MSFVHIPYSWYWPHPRRSFIIFAAHVISDVYYALVLQASTDSHATPSPLAQAKPRPHDDAYTQCHTHTHDDIV